MTHKFSFGVENAPIDLTVDSKKGAFLYCPTIDPMWIMTAEELKFLYEELKMIFEEDV